MSSLEVTLTHEQWTYVLAAMANKAEVYRSAHLTGLERHTQSIIDELVKQLNGQLD